MYYTSSRNYNLSVFSRNARKFLFFLLWAIRLWLITTSLEEQPVHSIRYNILELGNKTLPTQTLLLIATCLFSLVQQLVQSNLWLCRRWSNRWWEDWNGWFPAQCTTTTTKCLPLIESSKWCRHSDRPSHLTPIVNSNRASFGASKEVGVLLSTISLNLKK